MKCTPVFDTIEQLGSKIGDIMDEMIQMLDLAVNCYTAKETMKKAVAYMQSEPMNLVEMLTSQTILRYTEQEELLKLQEFDLIFAGDREVLAAVNVTEEKYLQEADEMLFLKMFLRYLHKNHKKVFLLTEEQSLLQPLLEYAKRRYSGIKIVGTATMEEHGVSDDMIINKVNGTEADCVMAFLASPLQEEFALRNRALLNARVWLGLGTEVKDKLNGSAVKDKWKTFWARQFLKKRVKEEKKKTR